MDVTESVFHILNFFSILYFVIYIHSFSCIRLITSKSKFWGSLKVVHVMQFLPWNSHKFGKYERWLTLCICNDDNGGESWNSQSLLTSQGFRLWWWIKPGLTMMLLLLELLTMEYTHRLHNNNHFHFNFFIFTSLII